MKRENLLDLKQQPTPRAGPYSYPRHRLPTKNDLTMNQKGATQKPPNKEIEPKRRGDGRDPALRDELSGYTAEKGEHDTHTSVKGCIGRIERTDRLQSMPTKNDVRKSGNNGECREQRTTTETSLRQINDNRWKQWRTPNDRDEPKSKSVQRRVEDGVLAPTKGYAGQRVQSTTVDKMASTTKLTTIGGNFFS